MEDNMSDLALLAQSKLTETYRQRAEQAEAELQDMTQKRDTWYEDCKKAESERDEYKRQAELYHADMMKVRAERDQWKNKYELAFRVAKQKQDERDAARYEATMTASRKLWDLSLQADNERVLSALRFAFRQVAGKYAEVKS